MTRAEISYGEYLNILRDLGMPDADIADYTLIKPGKGAFDFDLGPNSKRIRMTPEDWLLENGIALGNSIARWRRHARFHRRIDHGETLPVLVSEGDSWFQFPIFIDDIIDHLDRSYLIWSVGAAGDPIENIVSEPKRGETRDYIQALREQAGRVRGFLFSAGGNDIIGRDVVTGKPVLEKLLNDFNGDIDDIAGHIDMSVLGDTLAFIQQAILTMIKSVRNEPGLQKLPIVIHGYDYCFPYPWGENDPRSPNYVDPDKWLGLPMRQRGITAPSLQRGIITFMIDALYDMLGSLARDPVLNNVWLVDCRNTLSEVSDWHDEVHATSAGFAKIATRFHAIIEQALSQEPGLSLAAKTE